MDGAVGAAPTESAFGPDPSPAEVEDARRWHESAAVAALARFMVGSVSAAELGDRALSGSIAAISQEVAGENRFPLWQFTLDGKVIEGVLTLAESYPGSVLALSGWMLQPCRGLGGKVPLSLLLQGDAGTVIACARAMGWS